MAAPIIARLEYRNKNICRHLRTPGREPQEDYAAASRQAGPKCKLTEIFVKGYYNPLLTLCMGKDRGVVTAWRYRTNPKHIMPVPV